jgi:Mrp family chromosome partitioning ATPase
VTGGTTIDDATAMPGARVLTRWAASWYLGCALLFGLVGAAVGYAITPLLPASYTTQSQLVVGSPQELSILGDPVATTGWTNPVYAAKILGSQEIAVATSRELGGGRLTPKQVRHQVTIDGPTDSPVITISATADSPQLAQDLANAVTRAYVAVETRGSQERAGEATDVLNQLLTGQQQRLAAVQEQLRASVAAASASAAGIVVPTDRADYIQATLGSDITYQSLRDEAAALATQISGTQNALRQAAVNSGVLQSGVDQVIDAPLPEATARATHLRNAAIGGLLGAILGGLVAWRLTESRRTLDPALAAMTLGAPFLGSVGRARALRGTPGFVDFSADTRAGSELKVVASSLLLSARRRNLDSIVVTSAHRREGKSVLARNLAAAGEYTGQAVVLVDAGFGPPTTSQVLGIDNSPGLAEVIDGGSPAQVLHHIPYGDDGRVPVMSIGLNGFATEPGRRLDEARRRNWVRALQALEPMTPLIDAPALNEHPLALQLATGGGLVVIASPRTSVADLEIIRTRAEVADLPVLGFVINEPPARFRNHRDAGRVVPVAPTDPGRTGAVIDQQASRSEPARADREPAAG